MLEAHPPRTLRIGEVSGILLALLTIVASIAVLLLHKSWWSMVLPVIAGGAGGAVLLLILRENRTQARLRDQAEALRQKVREANENNRWLKLTEANAHVGHWRLDLRTNEVFWSDETARIHGLEPGYAPKLEEAINFYHPDDRQMVGEAVETARSTGEPFSYRARLLRADGDIRHAESIGRLQYDAAGQPVVLFGVFADRTEEEAMRHDLREARDDARALADAKSAFLAHMSHEIRTPMNGVMGFIDLLLASDLNPEQRRHAELIAESGRNLHTLLNDILDLSKVEAGRMELHPRPTELEGLIASALRLVGPLAREKGLEVACEIDHALPALIMIDGLRLRQIINNLIANAIKFTDAGQVELKAEAHARRLVITVSDSGIGIDKSFHGTIFEAFAQVEEGGPAQRGGTGLGLAICRQLAELMSGTLTVESDPGHGSRFVLALPLIEADTQRAQRTALPRPRAAPTRHAGASILLAEDFDINRELVGEMAKRLYLDLHEAENGAEAVAKIRQASELGRPYSLVLMDLQMPVMDGYAATRIIREAGFDPETLPIVALTANAFADDIEACHEAGMQAHLAKPLSFESFRAAIERWLAEDRPRAA